MPLYMCHWINGDISFVRGARNKREALEALDETYNASGRPIIPIPDFMVSLGLTDERDLKLPGFEGPIAASQFIGPRAKADTAHIQV